MSDNGPGVHAGRLIQPATVLTAIVMLLCAGMLTHAQPAPTAAEEAPVVRGELMWAPRSNGEIVAWEAARQYCTTLELGGHSDWRLPTLTELESVHDADNEAGGHIASPLRVSDCCLWSGTSLAELPAEELGLQGGQSNPADRYYWGLHLAGAVRFYSVVMFPDGEALCVRNS